MAHAPTLDDPDACGATPAPDVQDDLSWPSGWWLLPAVLFGLWFWVRIFLWLIG